MLSEGVRFLSTVTLYKTELVNLEKLLCVFSECISQLHQLHLWLLEELKSPV